jgi:hypothetical protein
LAVVPKWIFKKNNITQTRRGDSDSADPPMQTLVRRLSGSELPAPALAKFDGMPRSPIDANLAEVIAPAERR